MHQQCALDWREAANSRAFYDLIAERDGERCHGCGAVPIGWVPYCSTRQDAATTLPWWYLVQLPPETAARYRCGDRIEIERRVLLHVDHTVPLWKAAGVKDHEKLRQYFLPGNLRLLCYAPFGSNDCHGRKTSAEAAERAHFRRLVDANHGARRARR